MYMNLKSKWSIIAGTVLVSGALLTTGVVFAANGSTTEAAAAAATAQAPAKTQADRLDAAVTSGKITQAEADVLKQLDGLRQAAMDKLKADSQTIIDQAVKDGKLTQDQADKLAQHDDHMGGRDGHGGWDKDGQQGSQPAQGSTSTQTN
jgi:polyhydroxyalkanoate synthesis regulator phasin